MANVDEVLATMDTPEEAEKMDAAEKSGFVEESEIDWDNLQKYAG